MQIPNLPSIPGLQVESSVQRLGGSVKLYMKTLRMFKDALPGYIDEITSSHAAGDLDTLRRGLHTLKGLAATVGAVELADESARLEHMVGEESTLPDASALEGLKGMVTQMLDTVSALSFE